MRTQGAFSAAGGTVKVLQLPPTCALIVPVLRQIGLAEMVDELCPLRPDAKLSHGQCVEFLLLHILQDNRRWPLYLLDHWAERHNLQALYDCPARAFNDSRIGRTLDALAAQTQDLHTKFVTRIIAHFRLPVRAVLWDLTHVTFEGAYEHSALVEAGHGHGRVNEKQCKVSLHADAESALPVMYEALAGATNQTPLAEGYLGQLQRRLERTDLIVVSDKAGLSYENIEAYRRHGGHFVGPLQTTPAEAALMRQPSKADFKELEYRSASKPNERFMYYQTTVPFIRQKHRQPLQVPALVIYSTQKHRDDVARRDKDLAKTTAELAKVRACLNKGHYTKRAYALEHLPKKIKDVARGIVCYELLGEDKQLSLRYWIDEPALARAQRLDGRYLLVHNIEASPDEVFNLYKRQHMVESCFRSFNSGLRVKPIWLHNDNRIKALVFVWVLALTVFVLLGILAQRARLSNEPYYHKLTPRAMIQIFDYLSVSQITMPGHPPEYQLHLTDAMIEILEALGLHDPQKLLNQQI
jgi:transposase